MPVEVWEWRRPETESRPAGERSLPAHTTRPPLWLADRSRRSCCLTKRRQVAPFVGLIERMFDVDDIPGIDLGCPMLANQRAESFV
jgi:hypothetical protein